MGAALLLPDDRAQPLVDGMCIGRDPGCDLRLDESFVSREHATINQHSDGRWYVTDMDSRNGTYVDDVRVARGGTCRLRHGSRLRIADVVLVASIPTITPDPASTASLDLSSIVSAAPLSPYQLSVVRLLAKPWLETGEEPASNADIAAALGTPEAVDAVKAALRRAYAKAGLSGAAAATKRRALCRIARERGWL